MCGAKGKRAAVIVMLFSLSACEGEREITNRKATYPVTGEVYVDGQPVGELKVTCHSVKGLDKANPTSSSALTDEDGTFAISTYYEGDGVPEGDYVLTFFWGINRPMRGRYDGPDKLNERYDDPARSTFKFSVESGTPTDLGRLDLTTK